MENIKAKNQCHSIDIFNTATIPAAFCVVPYVPHPMPYIPLGDGVEDVDADGEWLGIADALKLIDPAANTTKRSSTKIPELFGNNRNRFHFFPYAAMNDWAIYNIQPTTHNSTSFFGMEKMIPAIPCSVQYESLVISKQTWI